MYGCVLFLCVYLIKFVDAGENVTKEFGLKMNNNETAANLPSSSIIPLPRDSRSDSHGPVAGHISGHGASHGPVVGYSTTAEEDGGPLAFFLAFGVIGLVLEIVCCLGSCAALGACIWCCVQGHCCCPKRKADQPRVQSRAPVGLGQPAYQPPPVQPPQQQMAQGAGYPQQSAPHAAEQQEQQIQKQQIAPEITEPVQA